MNTIFLVKPEELEVAKDIEKKLLGVHPASGILFVGVDVQPSSPLSPEPVYEIFIGCRRDYDPRIMEPLVRNTLSKDYPHLKLTVQARKGFDRSLISS